MKNILILKEDNIAFEVDENKKLVYFYHFIAKEIQEDSKSILLTIDSKLKKEIDEHFNVDIQEYSVVIDDAPRKEISKKDKEKIYSERPKKYLMMFFILVIVSMIGSDEMQPYNSNFFAFMALFGVSLVLILIIGKEMYRKDQIVSKLKHNITTKPLPTQEEQIEILESKVATLLQINSELQSNKKASL